MWPCPGHKASVRCRTDSPSFSSSCRYRNLMAGMQCRMSCLQVCIRQPLQCPLWVRSLPVFRGTTLEAVPQSCYTLHRVRLTSVWPCDTCLPDPYLAHQASCRCEPVVLARPHRKNPFCKRFGVLGVCQWRQPSVYNFSTTLLRCYDCGCVCTFGSCSEPRGMQ